MTQSFTYEDMEDTLANIIKQATGCDLYDQDDVGPQQAYPFFTYRMINPKIPLTDTEFNYEEFEVELHLDCHSNRAMGDNGAWGIAAAAVKALLNDANTQQLTSQSIYIVNNPQIDATDTILSIQVEHQAGFDLRLRVRDGYHDKANYVEGINIDGHTLNRNSKE